VIYIDALSRDVGYVMGGGSCRVCSDGRAPVLNGTIVQLPDWADVLRGEFCQDPRTGRVVRVTDLSAKVRLTWEVAVYRCGGGTLVRPRDLRVLYRDAWRDFIDDYFEHWGSKPCQSGGRRRKK